MEEAIPQTEIEAKRESARRLLEGDGVDKDEAKAVSLLEDCVAHGDADAMVMLCLLYTSPSPRDLWLSRMPSSA